MISGFFNTFFYEPLYNGLIFLVSVIPGADIGIAVVLLTLIVKGALFPFTHKGIQTQSKLRTLEPDIKDLKEKHSKDKQEQARQVMELYRKHGVSPFSGCLTVLVQLPVIFALYWVFWKGLSFDPALLNELPYIPGHINTALLNHDILYSFVHMPEFVKTHFLGFIDMTGKSILLALLAGVSQYFQIKLSMPDVGKLSLKSTGSLKDDLVQSMKFQMRYILPIFVSVFAYTISAAVALYWVTSNAFSIVQELLVKRKAEALQSELKRDNT